MKQPDAFGIRDPVAHVQPQEAVKGPPIKRLLFKLVI
jgi:hypothetical protein